ncbi:MAG TPA: glycosyltransferase family 4 protein [Terriglobales bacterium]|nr:glycosyltransferase family 4 protein [Terriglobales bacterium]
MGTALQVGQLAPKLAEPASRPHILLIHQAFTGPDEAGGTRHYELLEKLCVQDFRATVITGATNYFSGSARAPLSSGWQLQIVIAEARADFHKSYTRRLVAFVRFAVASFVAGLRLREVDLVLATSPPIFQAISSWLIAAIRRKPLVLEIRDLWPKFAEALGVLRNPLVIYAAERVERFLYRRADLILINSPGFRDHVIALGADPKRIAVIANGADPDSFDPKASGDEFRSEHGLTGKFVVMYAGATGPANDLECLLHAADRVRSEKHIAFVVVGAGKALAKLKREAKRLRLHNVRLVTPQPKSRMREVLAAANVCVATLKNAPALHATYPNKVFDYMAAGRPVVLAIKGPIREVLEKARCGIPVPPGDDAALAKAILLLRNSRELRLKMGKAGRQYMERHFNRKQQAAELAEHLHALTTHAAGARR